MIVGVAAVELHIHGSQSLKAKRGVVRSITQRVRNRFNLSIAEVGGHRGYPVDRLGGRPVGLQKPGLNDPDRRRHDRVSGFGRRWIKSNDHGVTS